MKKKKKKKKQRKSEKLNRTHAFQSRCYDSTTRTRRRCFATPPSDIRTASSDCFLFFFFKQKTAYEISTRDWSSDVCSSDLDEAALPTFLICEQARRHVTV